MSAMGEGDSLVNLVLILWTSFCVLLGAMVGWSCHACRPWRFSPFASRGTYGCMPAPGQCSKGRGKGPAPPTPQDTGTDSEDLTPRVSDIDSPCKAFHTHCKFERTDVKVAAAIRKRDKKRQESPSFAVPGTPPPKGRQMMYHTDSKGTMVHTDPYCRQLKSAFPKSVSEDSPSDGPLCVGSM